MIFGWLKNGDDIEPLGILFDHQSLLPVFDTDYLRWNTLTFPEIVKLGVDRSLRYVRAHDEAHAKFHIRNRQANPEAHDAASEYAYSKAKIYEESARGWGQASTTFKTGLIETKKHYNENYNKAYQRHAGGASGSG